MCHVCMQEGGTRIPHCPAPAALQMEDLKGKIRVYCRVRPMLKFEKDKGQQCEGRVMDVGEGAQPGRALGGRLVECCSVLLCLAQCSLFGALILLHGRAPSTPCAPWPFPLQSHSTSPTS